MSRLQHGSIRKEGRKKGAVWVYRYYATRDHDGKRVERTLTIGAANRFPTESAAWAEIERRRMRERINEPGRVGAVTFGELIAHYTQHELADQSLAIEPRSHTTVSTYLRVLRLRVLPRWGSRIATSIKPLEVEQWLKALKQEKRLANPTLAKTRNVMSLVFRHGIRHSLIQGGEGSNPLQYVRCRTTSEYESMTIEPHQGEHSRCNQGLSCSMQPGKCHTTVWDERRKGSLVNSSAQESNNFSGEFRLSIALVVRSTTKIGDAGYHHASGNTKDSSPR